MKDFHLSVHALMLSTLIRGAYLMSLIEYRFLGIIIGSFIGLGVAWVMNVGLQHYLNVDGAHIFSILSGNHISS